MNIAFKVCMASALALATAVPAAAQYYQPTQQYQQDLQQYQSQQRDYQRQQEAYQARQASYQAARADWERRRANWESARAAYDARWGYGAYLRTYGPAPVWDTQDYAGYPVPAYAAPYANAYGTNSAYAAPYGNTYGTNGAYAAPYANTYGTNSAYTAPAPVRCNNNSTVTAGVVGALAGAAFGSNVAARNARTEGAVLGAAVGGAIGAGVGRANDRYKCDTRGPYFSRAETIPYRESYAYGYDADRYRRYSSMGCRLAAAPVDSYGQDYRYVRVCPDASGRYRLVG